MRYAENHPGTAVTGGDPIKRLYLRATGVEPDPGLLAAYQAGRATPVHGAALPRLTVGDLRMLTALLTHGEDQLSLLRAKPRAGRQRHFLRLCSEQTRYLDEVLPHLKHLGLRVIDHLAFGVTVGEREVRFDSFTVEPAHGAALSLTRVSTVLRECLAQVLAGRAESDGLNGLITLTGLDWQAVDVFRAYRNYALQIKPRYTAERFHQALLNHPRVAALLFEYFDARFNPASGGRDAGQREEDALGRVCAALSDALVGVDDSLEDHILRELFNLIDATSRTNFYLRRESDDYFVAIKLNALGLLDMPTPKPICEIYVHAVAMEGIHLRGATVSRGGIRWSNRPDDFRTEIHGLMRTQMLKNALIVPHGAKGGFVVKTGGTEPEVVKSAYRTLIRGMLDLTDNRVDGGTTLPDTVLRYDDADPYLVVAADKGTATFSDIANGLAADYGFWLGDAFASGGSRGYDHKALGITARGAWECVRHHFRELGQDADHDPIGVVGIGSMDGDVFGNGLLLSKSLRLMAAFDGRHIFLDPNPPAKSAWLERHRLFLKPHSNWADYDRALISEGGGVYPRGTQDIPLAPAVRRWLGVHAKSLSGDELIRALLTAPVDLLWLGGIGTYVKAADEVHEAIGDRANDAVRVDAQALRARVVAEGANLGFTQRARIEFARNGGLINMDAIDNSAGVDLSDHEVNLKILMGSLARQGRISGTDERDALLRGLTGGVCEQVIAHNREQCACLSRDQVRCAERPEDFLEVAHRLENAGLLDRSAECFPAGREVRARSPAILYRPELAVLMLSAKLGLKRALLEHRDLLTDARAVSHYLRYFPLPLRETFGDLLLAHPLRAEITATVIGNHLIGIHGACFLAIPGDGGTRALADTADRHLQAT